MWSFRSNNTNKLSPQEHSDINGVYGRVQIIQINLVLKNDSSDTIIETICSNNTNKLSPQERIFTA